MPLARIVARVAENAHILAEDLRARGFEVQTRSPEERSPEPADLEITLEDCAIEDALSGAAHAPLSQDVWVFIAPGAVSENLRPIRVASLTPEAVAKPVPAEPAPERKAEFTALAEATTVLPGLDPVATAIGDLGTKRELAEHIPAMTFQAEPLATEPLAGQEPESNLIPIDAGIVAAASDQEIHLKPVAEVQDVASDPEVVTTQGHKVVSYSPVREPVATGGQDREEPQPVAFETGGVSEAWAGIEARMEVEPMVPPATGLRPDKRGLPAYRVRIRRMSRNEKLFWKIAPLASMLTLAFLLLAASSHRFSPLPPGLLGGSGETRQSVPFAKGKSGTTNPAGRKATGSATPGAAIPVRQADKHAAAKQPTLKPLAPNPLVTNTVQGTANSGVSLAASSERLAVAPTTRPRSLASSDADYVAKDTIVRYNAAPVRSAAPRRPRSLSSEASYVAKDSVVRHGTSTSLTAPPRK